jgi:hypothetical protein
MTTVERPWTLRVERPTPDIASVELTGVWRKEHQLPDPSEVLREIQGASPVHLLTLNTVGVYTLIFGALVSTAPILIRHRGLRVVVPSDDQTWTTR